MKWNCRGRLYPARSRRHNSINSVSVTASSRHDTKATGTSPHLASARAHHRGFRDSLVGHQYPLDLGGIDILTAGLDHVFGAIDEIERAVLVAPEYVAHVEPAAAKIAGVGFLRLPVAGKQQSGRESPVRRASPGATSLSEGSTSLHLAECVLPLR